MSIHTHAKSFQQSRKVAYHTIFVCSICTYHTVCSLCSSHVLHVGPHVHHMAYSKLIACAHIWRELISIIKSREKKIFSNIHIQRFFQADNDLALEPPCSTLVSAMSKHESRSASASSQALNYLWKPLLKMGQLKWEQIVLHKPQHQRHSGNHNSLHSATMQAFNGEFVQTAQQHPTSVVYILANTIAHDQVGLSHRTT